MKVRIFLIAVLSCFLGSSCGEKDPLEKFIANEMLRGTKWITTDFDYSLGDDYVGFHEQTTMIVFHSLTDGAIHYSNKDIYSDVGSSITEIVEHFNYELDGTDVYLNYITDGFGEIHQLKLEGNSLSIGECRFEKSTFSNSDREWVNSVCGKSASCSWYSNVNGGLWIVGEGPMADYDSFSSTPWFVNHRIPNKLYVKEGVTKIGSYAFANPSIGQVEMPDKSLKEVGAAAFQGSSISQIWLSQRTEIIGRDAFLNCKYLKTVNVPDNIVSIGDGAFSGTALNVLHLDFSASLKQIGAYAYEGCEASYLTFKEGVQDIKNGAFLGNFCGIDKELVLPNSLITIGATVFGGTYNKVVIGSNIGQIGEKAFVSGVTSGHMFINRSSLPVAGENIIVEPTNWSPVESRWTLHVPAGSKSLYMGKSPWNKFKAIVEDDSLGEEDSGNLGDDNQEVEYSDATQDEIDANDFRRGSVASGFSKGSGTYDDPYIISTASELRYFSDAVRGGEVFKSRYIKLGADIVVNREVLNDQGELNGDGSNLEPWIPIGRLDPSYFFCGTFDGNGFTISGLYCNRPEGQNVGLFGRVLGSVKNVVIRDSYFVGKEYVGGIVGTTRANVIGTTIPSSLKDYYHGEERSISFINCINEATVVGDSNVGGIVGYMDNLEQISECHNMGRISGSKNVGGILGKSASINSGQIISCINDGNIGRDDTQSSSCGGIVGNGYCKVMNCLNTGVILASGTAVGGICGVIGKSTSRRITNCLNLSSDIGDLASSGAIVGCNNGVTVSYNYYLYTSGLKDVGTTLNGGVTKNNYSMTKSELTDVEFISKLNSRVESGWSKWKIGLDGLPVLEWL